MGRSTAREAWSLAVLGDILVPYSHLWALLLFDCTPSALFGSVRVSLLCWDSWVWGTPSHSADLEAERAQLRGQCSLADESEGVSDFRARAQSTPKTQLLLGGGAFLFVLPSTHKPNKQKSPDDSEK